MIRNVLNERRILSALRDGYEIRMRLDDIRDSFLPLHDGLVLEFPLLLLPAYLDALVFIERPFPIFPGNQIARILGGRRGKCRVLVVRFSEIGKYRFFRFGFFEFLGDDGLFDYWCWLGWFGRRCSGWRDERRRSSRSGDSSFRILAFQFFDFAVLLNDDLFQLVYSLLFFCYPCQLLSVGGGRFPIGSRFVIERNTVHYRRGFSVSRWWLDCWGCWRRGWFRR